MESDDLISESLRAQAKQSRAKTEVWIASELTLLAMTATTHIELHWQPRLIAHANCPSGYFVAGLFACIVGQITTIISAIPPHQEGRFAIVTDVEVGCGGRLGAAA